MEHKYDDVEHIKEQEYEQELHQAQRKDFKFSWVSSSAYLFYLTITCLILFTWGGCYRLYTKRFEKPKVTIQESTLYTPKYK
ncbi:hypothetical protein A8C56_10090 [Niabella ginsenosidivorans]|uniref:Uncharacterized protein n=1 Tax=Niabella ginsenosidivorans TaxID=1176587 RepID=A0A1A9I0W3_9BACT|nr:hypothetical protein [Niabella ginsenosidivorans]ANH81288.1 hypothetical protein A8C56_10090 [Niabella ginsenosidivorans]